MAHEFHSLLDPFQILVINGRGRLKKVQCPFRVLCKELVEGLEPNRFYYVGRVEKDANNICYVIHSRLYQHSHFRLFIA